MHWKEIHAGHFIPRSAGNNLYFNEENVNAQCCTCNTFNEGEQYAYSIQLDGKYGDGTAKKLYKEKNKFKKFAIKELEGMIEHYKNEVKEIKKIKGL